jgi:MerR family redox-sensitive transcriptional activator SoxR
MEEISIGELARRAGLRPSAIRYYERAGLLAAPRRHNGRRRYHLGAVERLRTIRYAQQAGFTIAELRALFQAEGDEASPSARWHALARRKLVQLEALALHLERMKGALEATLACQCRNADECVLAGAYR